MRIITCASYYGTGSSAITDYLSEFTDVFSLTNYEFRFIQDPDGISDLEYNLVENHNRHNSGHALKRFERLVDFYAGNRFVKKYEPFFDNQWKIISYEYIGNLLDFKFKGWWQYDLLDKGLFFYYRKLFLNKLMHMTVWKHKPDKHLNVLPKEFTYCSRPTEEIFLKYTKQYLERLFTVANKSHACDIMVDQLVPPSNVNRFLRYFDDIKVFIVDRDPRDLYILEKHVWHGGVIPTESVELFCKWYIYTRAHRKIEQFDSSKVMFIKFEDLIYKYDKTTKEINQWLGFTSDSNRNRKQIFNPNVSINNTRLWGKMKANMSDIRYIENELSEYLYN